MTDHRIAVTAADLLYLEIECPKCRVTNAIPRKIDEQKFGHRMAMSCVACGTDFPNVHDRELPQSLEKLVQVMQSSGARLICRGTIR